MLQKAIRDFYGIGLGAWVTLIFVVVRRFDMVLRDRFPKIINYPVFYPPMHFLIDKTNVQTTLNDYLPPITSLLSYRHNISDIFIDFQKKSSEYDVIKCFLVWYTFPINMIFLLVFHLASVKCFHFGFCRCSFTREIFPKC